MAFSYPSSVVSPFPGETVYSWVSRIGILSGYSSNHAFLKSHLGYLGQQLTSTFPPFLPAMSEITGLPMAEIIRNHTCLALYRPFVCHDAYHSTIDKLACSDGKDCFQQFSLLANRIPESSDLFYCPMCSELDLSTYGVSYWHVAHQLPWINYCPFHLIKLGHLKRERKLLVLPPQVVSESKGLTKASLKQAKFAQDAYALWSLNFEAISPHAMRKVYLHGLNANNLVCQQGSVKQAKWRDRLKKYWVDELPEELINAFFVGRVSKSYPTNLIYQLGAQFHPLKHLLVIQHLFGSLSAFLNCYSNPHELELRPHYVACEAIERVSPEKTDLLIKQLRNGMSLRQAAKRANVSVGYAKSIAIQNNIPIERRAQFLFATERAQIISRLKAGESTASIAQNMECSRGAIEQILTQLPDIKKLRIQIRFKKQRDIHRSAVKECLNSLELPTRGKVQKLQRSAYTWLFKHDKEWLYKALPEAIPRINRRRGY